MTQMLEVPAEPIQPSTETKRMRFPTAFTVLAAVLLVVWGLSFVITFGTYQVDPETGSPKPGTYQSASGLINLITPTSAVIMGGLALSRIGYDRYLRFALPFFGIALGISLAFVALGAALG